MILKTHTQPELVILFQLNSEYKQTDIIIFCSYYNFILFSAILLFDSKLPRNLIEFHKKKLSMNDLVLDIYYIN